MRERRNLRHPNVCLFLGAVEYDKPGPFNRKIMLGTAPDTTHTHIRLVAITDDALM